MLRAGGRSVSQIAQKLRLTERQITRILSGSGIASTASTAKRRAARPVDARQIDMLDLL